jgi:ATP-dependent DNA ligase
MKFMHMKFLNKTAKVINGKLVVDMGKNDIKEVPYGKYATSRKYDGVLCAIRNGELLSSSLKPLPNIRLRAYFKELIEFSKSGITLTGEMYSHKLSFQEIISVVMTQDKQVPEHFQFHCFDALKNDNVDESFINRLEHIPVNDKLVKVEQIVIDSHKPEEFVTLFNKYLEDGYEGLIIKNIYGRFKCGRTTLNEGIGYKFKPYETEDAQIIDVIQATEAREGSERTVNEMGYSETSKKKDDRVLIEKASAFLVRWNNLEFKVTIAEDDAEKVRIWKNREEFKTGKHKVEFKAMFDVGVKDMPRHPTSLRIRMAENEE